MFAETAALHWSNSYQAAILYYWHHICSDPTIVHQVWVVREQWRELVQADQDHKRYRVLAGRQRHHVDTAGADDAPVGQDGVCANQDLRREEGKEASGLRVSRSSLGSMI